MRHSFDASGGGGRTMFECRLWVFACSVVLFTICLAVMPDSIREKPCSDCAGWYFPVAENLANGKGLVIGNQSRPALDRPPGQVLFLSGLFRIVPAHLVSREVAVYAYNIFLLSISSVLLFSISCSVWGVRGGTVTVGLWVTSPFVLWFLNQPYSEVPFFVALYSGVWLALKARRTRHSIGWLILVGIALGVATLIRPIGFALLVPIAVFLWTSATRRARKIRAVEVFVVVLGYVTILAPWQIYLWDQTREFNFLSDGPHGHRSVVEGFIFGVRSEEYKKEIALHPDVRVFMEDMYEIVYLHDRDPELFERYGPDGLYDVRSIRSLVQIAGDRFAQDLSLAVRFIWLKVTRSWYGTDSHNHEGIAALLQGFYLIVCVLGSIGAWKQKKGQNLMVLVWGVTVYFWMFAVVFTPLVRYMVPALGLLFLIAPGFCQFLRLKNDDSIYR